VFMTTLSDCLHMSTLVTPFEFTATRKVDYDTDDRTNGQTV